MLETKRRHILIEFTKMYVILSMMIWLSCMCMVWKGNTFSKSSHTKSHSMINANYTYSHTHKSIINIHKINITVEGKVTCTDVIRNELWISKQQAITKDWWRQL
jgi:hypothetical protein